VLLKPGTHLISAVCTTEMIVVRGSSNDVSLTIGGVPPIAAAAERADDGVRGGHGGGTLLGKRYVDAASGIELLCTKAGEGVPAVDGMPFSLKDAKLLPSSD
jgi:hypothetical protein